MKELNKQIQELSERLLALLDCSDDENLTEHELELFIEFEELIKRLQEEKNKNDLLSGRNQNNL